MEDLLKEIEQARIKKGLCEYILKDSYQNALKVRQEIIDAVLSLPEHIQINTTLISTR